MDKASLELRDTISLGPDEDARERSLTLKCSDNRVRRVQLYNECIKNLVITLCIYVGFYSDYLSILGTGDHRYRKIRSHTLEIRNLRDSVSSYACSP